MISKQFRRHFARTICLGGAALSVATDALAGDLWVGTYGGVTAVASRAAISGSTLKADGTVGANASDEAAQNLRDETSGLGLFVGVRKRLNSGLIVGLEAEGARLAYEARTRDEISSGTYVGQPAATLHYQAPWLATARVLAGWSFGDVLVFGSGGAAFLTEKETRTQYQAVTATTVTAAQFSETDRVNRFGHALGAGLEWRWGKPWAMRAEYLHARFPAETFRFPDARGGAQSAYTTVQGRVASNGMHLNTVRVGVTYTFGAGR